MRVVLFCTGRRGLAFLTRLTALIPDRPLTVISSREEPWEPPYLADLEQATSTAGGTFLEARRLDAERWQQITDPEGVELILAVGWRYLIPASTYETARLGSFTFHDSLLPAYRGFSPTVWAMINGETRTGVTLFRMTQEVDAGDVVDQIGIEIGPTETIATVSERVTDAYLTLLERNLDPLLRGAARPSPQDPSLATYTCKRLPADNEIDWRRSSRSILDLIRAVTAPYPGAFTWLNDDRLTIWSARRPDALRSYVGRVPGRVVEIVPGVGAVVLTGDGTVLVTEVQLGAGSRAVASAIIDRLSSTLG